MTTEVDLRGLVVERPAADFPPPAPPRWAPPRAWVARWLAPLLLAGGFAGLVGWAARDQWLPARAVTVTPVVLVPARARAAETGPTAETGPGAEASPGEILDDRTPLFEAPGWIEPSPAPLACAALSEGLLTEVLVVEGQDVEAGQPLARLDEADVRLDERRAEAELALRQAERDAARAAAAAARRHVEHPARLRAAAAEADAGLAALETEAKKLPFEIQAAEARLAFALRGWEGVRAAGEAVSPLTLARAQSEHAAAAAGLAELRQREPDLTRQQEAWRRKRDALRDQLEHMVDEIQARDEAAALEAAAEARVRLAEIQVAAAALRRERLVVRAPTRGRVLRVLAVAGQRLPARRGAGESGVGAAGDGAPGDGAPGDGAIVTLYDPARLQVRVDVRFEDLAKTRVGQPARVALVAADAPLTGRVIAIAGQADIQKNTLAVKVLLEDPAPAARPEMLARVTFYAAAGSAPPAPRARLLAPAALIETTADGAFAWVADAPAGVARRRRVETRAAAQDARGAALVEVTSGLNLFDKLIVSGRQGLVDGARVRVVGEEP